jgi:acyl phosphate:glycerol-3-phosphate acyltransferase
MSFINILFTAGICYLIGSIPFGLIIVKLTTGKDVRQIGSGRTGGTNAMRAAGLLPGILTAVMDVLKGVASGWVAQWLVPGDPWLKVLAAIFALWGAIHSIFLLEKDENGRWHLRGGAGGATGLGGAIALWNPAVFIILPIGTLVFLFVGYASVTTISVAVSALVIFAIRAVLDNQPFQYIAFGAAALVIVLYALRPNLKRLKEGTERVVGLRAYLQKKQKQFHL